MYTIKGQIIGISSIKFNRCADPLGTLNPGGRKKTHEQLLKDAEKKVHTDKRGIFFPRRGFKSCLLNGCRIAGLKDGKKQLWPLIKAVVYPQDDIVFGCKTHDGVDEAWTQNKQQQLIPNFCPFLEPGWKSDFELSVLDDSLSQAAIKTALDTAGLVVGLGSGRPEYGRFNVSKWSIA